MYSNKVNSTGSIAAARAQTPAAIKEITTIEEFSAFLKENKARIEQKLSSLSLYIGGGGGIKVGSQLWTKPDPTTEICVYIESNDSTCEIVFNLPAGIVVTGPLSKARIPATFLTKENILKALEN